MLPCVFLVVNVHVVCRDRRAAVCWRRRSVASSESAEEVFGFCKDQSNKDGAGNGCQKHTSVDRHRKSISRDWHVYDALTILLPGIREVFDDGDLVLHPGPSFARRLIK